MQNVAQDWVPDPQSVRPEQEAELPPVAQVASKVPRYELHVAWAKAHAPTGTVADPTAVHVQVMA